MGSCATDELLERAERSPPHAESRHAVKIVLNEKQMKEALALYLDYVLNQEHGQVTVETIDHAFSDHTVTFTIFSPRVKDEQRD